MSSIQFIKYETAWKAEKDKAIKFNQKNIYGEDNSSFDYHVRTRQACNMIYENDKFRGIQHNKQNKEKINKMKFDEYINLQQSGQLVIGSKLNQISPKFNRILTNIQKYIKDSKSIGKVLFYSEYRSDAGSEIFEQVLIANGYSKYDYKNTENEYDDLRYTFITGSESEIERKHNKEAFNNINNLYGEKIQIMIISSAGAEGISLTAVRQVHILEPYWNFVRINQVFGRAIRLDSHKDLEEKNRNDEQYLYLSIFPEGSTIKEIYDSIQKLDSWTTPDIKKNEDLVNILYSSHKELYSQIQKIIKIKSDTRYRTVDQIIFDIMENKYKISSEIIKVIKESSIDCIQHTRDNIILNENCIRFDSNIIDESAYFPGVDDTNLNLIDTKQLTSKIIKIKPNIYIISAKEDDRDILVYYKLDKKDPSIDIRYIRDKGEILGTLDKDDGIYYKYISEDSTLKEKLGNKFSIYQELYKLPDIEVKNINELSDYNHPNTFKDMFGYKVKHNLSDRFMFYPNIDKPIIRL